MKLPENATLIPIDVQQGFDFFSTPRNNPLMEENGLRLLSFWRQGKRHLIHVRHDSINPQSFFHPSHSGNNFRAGFAPLSEESLVVKSANSAFIGTDLELRLRRTAVDTLVLFGMSTAMCLSTTARHASNLGYKTIVVEDACACNGTADKQGSISADDVHRIHMATLAEEFATVVTTDTFLRDLSL